MKIKTKFWILAPVLSLSALLYTSCQPLREFKKIPTYQGTVSHNQKPFVYDKSKKTVVIVAHTNGTEIFDLMAPYCLFNATEQANVYIAAETKNPIVLLKGLYCYPTATFAELDSLKIKPDVLVLPAMISVFKDPKSPIIQWIKKHHTTDTAVLSVCAGSIVAAATGIYDGIPLATHASMFTDSKELFKNPNWVQNLSVTKRDHLYSTAGVSNAVEGSLTIIQDLFGKETLQKVMQDIRYPYATIQVDHKSLAVEIGHKLTIASKLIFRKNRKVGVLLQDGVSELALAGVIDTYNRTFPSVLETVVTAGVSVTSKYGLTLVPTSTLKGVSLDELHVLMPESLSKSELEKLNDIPIIQYNQADHRYIINQCLQSIKEQYGEKFENITKLLLDYN